MRVAVIGLGYVGSVTAACLADTGHTVHGVDAAPSKVQAVQRGETPIVEPGLGDLIAAAVADGRLTAGDRIDAVDDAEIALVCVGTPSLASGDLDLRYVEAVIDEIAGRLAARSTPLSIVLRSTVLPGTCARLIARIEAKSGLTEGVGFSFAFAPEFLREASAIADFHSPPFTVIGVETASSAQLPRELLSLIDAPLHVVRIGVAEGLKYASNAFHAVKVTFANEMARVLNASGVDGRDVMKLFTEDRELNISARYLRPGYAFGGSCLPKDVRALRARAGQLGQELPLIDSLAESNDAHIASVVNRVVAMAPRRVCLMGLAFKSDTDDLRESPYVLTAAALISRGLTVSAFDPVIDESRLVGANKAFVDDVLPELASLLKPTVESALEGADVVLLGAAGGQAIAHLLTLPVTVIDLSGTLPPGVESAMRERADATFIGAAW